MQDFIDMCKLWSYKTGSFKENIFLTKIEIGGKAQYGLKILDYITLEDEIITKDYFPTVKDALNSIDGISFNSEEELEIINRSF